MTIKHATTPVLLHGKTCPIDSEMVDIVIWMNLSAMTHSSCQGTDKTRPYVSWVGYPNNILHLIAQYNCDVIPNYRVITTIEYDPHIVDVRYNTRWSDVDSRERFMQWFKAKYF